MNPISTPKMKRKTLFLIALISSMAMAQIAPKQPTDFVPKGYVVFDKIYGDLNKDGSTDCVLIIKGTDSDQYLGNLDRNRRGIIVLLYSKGRYELAVHNKDCFSSENEDGGAYFPPILSIEIKKGHLNIHYAYGKYGYWYYAFRLKNDDFELIGYDQSNNRGPIIESVTSINFLTHKKQVKVNTNENASGGDEVFQTTWKPIKVKKRYKLSEIKDFDTLDLSVF